MTGARPRSASRSLRRYAWALIVSVALPPGVLLFGVLEMERRDKAVHEELVFYHLRTVTLARTAQASLTRLRTAVDFSSRSDRPKRTGQGAGFWSREAEARFQIDTALEEIERIERRFGCERCAGIVGRLTGDWERIVAALDVPRRQDVSNYTLDAFSVALLQLERVHEIEGDALLSGLRTAGWWRRPGALLASGLIVLVCGGLASGIYHRMRKMAREIDGRTAALRESEERFLQFSENVDAVFWMTEVDTETALIVSKAFEKVWGRTVESLAENPRSWIEAILPGDRARVLEGLQVIAEGRGWEDEYRIERPDGSIRWIRDRGFPVRNSEGRVVRMAGVAADVTEEKRVQEELRLSEGHLRSLMENAKGFMILRVRRDPAEASGGKVVFVSPVVEEIMGISDPADFNSYVKHIHEDDLARVLAALRRMTEDLVPLREEFRHFHPDREEWRWLRVIAAPVQEADTNDCFFNAIIIDVTEEMTAREGLEKAVEENQKLRDLAEAENVYLREEMRHAHLHGEIVGKSEALNAAMTKAERVARTNATVLLLGETGTGKELVARAIHRMSERSAEPMIAVNCAAIPANLVESELFGREKGAYTGASTSQKGRFETADGGTIFLDEVGELPAPMQAKLLRVLQEGHFERLGSAKVIDVDVRVIAATNRDLAKLVAEGEFREDLYYRLSVFPIEVPPLRERREDIPVLARHFVKEFAGKMGREVEHIAGRTMEEFKRYSWPGNVRELRNLIERGMILTSGKTLRVEAPRETGEAGTPIERMRLAEVEKRHILATLEGTGWKVRGEAGAAKILGLAPSTLESRMRKLGVERPKRA